uniref:mRNA decay factor PAT1 domain-containing protein n=1 Tax=Daucus carota subsp. sativus TaxID=79200 RepID=A0A164X4Q4_DAUCS
MHLVFDASQYAFFGNDAVEEVELGGLEDEEEDEIEYVPAGGVVDDVEQLDRDELNKAVSISGSADGTNDWGSRGSSFAQEWLLPELESPNLYNQHPGESYLLHRTSSYPEQQQQHIFQHQHFSSEPNFGPKSSFTSHPPPGGRSLQPLSNQLHNSNIHHLPGGNQLQLNAPSHLPFSSSQLQFTGSPHGSPFGEHLSQLALRAHPVDSQLQNQYINRTGSYPGDNSLLTNKSLHQQLPNLNGLMPPQLMQQHRMHRQFQPSFGHVSGLQRQPNNRHLPPAHHMMNNFEMLGSTDLRDQKPKLFLKGRQGIPYSNHGFDASNQWNDSGWPRFRAKYMSADEIENILRAQLAATHINDPYVDDYYHQACLAKKSTGAKLRRHFCPANLKDHPSRARVDNEPHPFLKVDALGRKPLEQEPMLAARVTIEDGLSLLLDVDDIDRYLQFNHLPDVVVQLRGRRQVLLEDLQSSLQLVDPLGENGNTVNLSPEDDLVFLRLVSLPKGRKLLCRYLQLLFSSAELIRVVCMAIFRHLRFLFGTPSADPKTAETTTNLVKIVSSCVRGMDLRALGACLASVVCSAEHPPLRPLGSSAGEGASVILISALERATELLRDPHTSANCSIPNRKFWQASFDVFFNLLTKYCISKYDTTVQSLLAQGLADTSTIGSETTKAMSREMPVELLRASLPHTNEQQRKVLLDFAQRSMPML